MKFPSSAGGPTTQTVGFFACDHREFANWLHEALQPGWTLHPASWTSVEDALEALRPEPVLSREACIRLGEWTLLLNNSPLGTDVGVLPMHAARDLECRGIRAVCVEDGESEFPARILEVYGPSGDDPLFLERSVAAANDGGRWVFETSGAPYPFEDLEAYGKRNKSSRLTGAMLREYLIALGVPIEEEPDWRSAHLIEKTN